MSFIYPYIAIEKTKIAKTPVSGVIPEIVKILAGMEDKRERGTPPSFCKTL